MEFPPSESIAWVVQQLKSHTSADLRKKFKFIDEIFDHSGIWSVGYFVSTIGLNEDQIRKYIEKKGAHDIGIDVSAEFS